MSDNLNSSKFKHQLIIIGNGFDLHCVLKSRFRDFFEGTCKGNQDNNDLSRKEKIKKTSGMQLNDFSKYIKNENLTAWDFIVCSGEGKENWSDVESCIENVLKNKRGEKITANEIKATLESIKMNAKQKIDSPTLINFVPYYSSASAFCVWCRYHDKVNQEKFDVYDLLFKELLMFEREFARYIESFPMDEKHPKEYSYYALRNFASLLFDNVNVENVKFLESNILSFNYTHQYNIKAIPTIIDKLRKEDFNIPTVVNVHGKSSDKIIIGIDGYIEEKRDGMQYNPDDIKKFTKTYRLMLRDGDNRKRLAYPYHAYPICSKTTNIVKIFGHSLAKADYSYFQSIFDIVDLYHGNTILNFYFNKDRKDSSKQEQKDKTCTRVFNLLNAYGATLDNKDHGKNLLHKLLLEDRLHVKPLPYLDDIEEIFNKM